MAELFKFDELRLKTEVQLIQLINHELDRGIRCACYALSSIGTNAAEEWNQGAQRAYAEASRLVPLAIEMAENERSRVESRLEHLDAMLQTLAVIRSKPSSADDEIAILASVS